MNRVYKLAGWVGAVICLPLAGAWIVFKVCVLLPVALLILGASRR